MVITVTDLTVPVCRRFAVCRRFDLFETDVAFWLVADSLCRHFDCRCFGLFKMDVTEVRHYSQSPVILHDTKNIGRSMALGISLLTCAQAEI